MTTTNGTPASQELTTLELSDTERYEILWARQQRYGPLPAEEREELSRLECRNTALKLCEAVYAAAGTSRALEQAFKDVQNGLCLTNGGELLEGTTMGVRAILDDPDALMAAVRVVLEHLEAQHTAA